MRIVFFSLIIFILVGCGYSPSAKYARQVVGEKISTSVTISGVDPENTVIIKDAVDIAILEVFHASLVSKETSTTHLKLKLGNLKYTPIEYDTRGFVVAYKTTVTLKINRQRKDENQDYTVFGSFDFKITANAVITDKQRFDAIRFSSQKAIRAFVAQVSAQGARNDHSKYY